MWTELVRMYSSLNPSEFKLSEFVSLRRRLMDITTAIDSARSFPHLLHLTEQYHNEVLTLGQRFSELTQVYRNDKLKNELMYFIRIFDRLNPDERVRIVRRYNYLTGRQRPLFNEAVVTRVFLEEFMSHVEARKLELFLDGTESGKRVIIDNKNVVLIDNFSRSISSDPYQRKDSLGTTVPTNFLMSVFDVLGLTTAITISDTPVVLDIRKTHGSLDVVVTERIVSEGKIHSNTRKLRLPIPTKR